MLSKEKHQGQQKTDALQEENRLAKIATDPSEGEAASVLREVARMQLENAHLKRRNLRVWSANVVLAAGIVIVATGALYVFPKYRYIPTTNNQAICEVTPESAPRVSAADVTNYAKDAVLNSYSYDYVNYRSVINEVASRWYTEFGREAFMKGLDASGNLRRVIDGRLILRSTATRTPQLEEISPATGITQSWTVVVPIAIEFFVGGADKPLSRQEFRASVKVVRVSASAANQKGIAVESVVLMPPRN